MGLQKPQLARPAAVFAIFGGKIPRTPPASSGCCPGSCPGLYRGSAYAALYLYLVAALGTPAAQTAAWQRRITGAAPQVSK